MKPEDGRLTILNATREPLRIGDLRTDPARRSVIVNGRETVLPELTWRLLTALVEQAPHPASFDELARAAWRRTFVSHDTIAQRVRLLRAALGDSSRTPRYVRTIRGEGYQLIPRVTADELEPCGASRSQGRSLAATAALAASVVVVGWGSDSATVDAERAAPRLVAAVTPLDLTSRAYVYLANAGRDDTERAVALFSDALASDPGDHRALTGLSLAYSLRTTRFDAPHAWAEEAEVLARRVIAENPGDAQAWRALGLSLDARGRVGAAIAGYRQAALIDPSDARARASAAYLLAVQGRLYEALKLEFSTRSRAGIAELSDLQIAQALFLLNMDHAAGAWLARARRLRPDAVFLADVEARALIGRGRFEDALHVVARAQQSRASHAVTAAAALLAMERDAEARVMLDAAAARSPQRHTARYVTAALAMLGGASRQEASYDVLASAYRQAAEEGDEWPDFAVEAAYVHAAAGEPALALEALRRARRLGFRDWRWLEASPYLSSLEDDAAFVELLAAIRADVAAERGLVEADEELRPLFAIPTAVSR